MRKRKPRSVSKKCDGKTSWGQHLLFVACVFAMAGVSLLFKSDVVLPLCTASGIPGVVSNSQLNGKLVHSGKKFLLDAADGEEHVLAKCVKRNCTGPYAILERAQPGQAAHAEFCGPYLTLVSLDKVPVHTKQPPTQAEIDSQAKLDRTGGLVCLVFLLAVALRFIILSARKRRAAALQS